MKNKERIIYILIILSLLIFSLYTLEMFKNHVSKSEKDFEISQKLELEFLKKMRVKE